jgi:hypothetical protein
MTGRIRRRKARDRTTDGPSDEQRLEWAASSALAKEMFRLGDIGDERRAMALSRDRRDTRAVRWEHGVGWVVLDDGPTQADVARKWLGPDWRP